MGGLASMEEYTIKDIIYFLSALLLWVTFLWSFSYIMFFKKIKDIKSMLLVLCQGINDQHNTLNNNTEALNDGIIDFLKKQNNFIDKLLKNTEKILNIKEDINENDHN